MDYKNYYLKSVYPKLNLSIVKKYDEISLKQMPNYHPLGNHQVIMIVALTGTGKTTTLNTLVATKGHMIEKYLNIIPSRREIADCIAIPTAQIILNEPLNPVTDRVKRFNYTHTFAENVDGGMAAAFSWVNVTDDYEGMILSEGIRGDDEIRYALAHFPKWHIIELALNPIVRLQRLSARRSAFDNVESQADVSFLPEKIQHDIKPLLKQGAITDDALTIIRAESMNYGLDPFADGDAYTNYHQIDVADKTPDQVAQDVYEIMTEITDARDQAC